MKKAILLLGSLLFIQMVSSQVSILPLEIGWQLKQARGVNWYPAKVPGCVHTALMENGIISDPFFGLNNMAVQWVDKEDWEYKTVFDLPQEMLKKENIKLHFNGLDTYADVFLNGEKILSADNMFIAWEKDIKANVKEKGNELRVYFNSPTRIGLKEILKYPYRYEAANDQSENGGMFDYRVSIFTRKAGYNYGWDWGPRLVTTGIWRPVEIQAWNDVRFDNIYYRQTEVNTKKALIETSFKIASDREQKVVVSITDSISNKVLAKNTISLRKGDNTASLSFSIRNPELWWTNGLGDAHLYTFKATIYSENESVVYDSQTTKTGLRTVKLITTADKTGHTFHFELNGIPVFMKGANYVPLDNFMTRVTAADYEKIILAAKEANMNMIRVWGGGNYEDDVFYDLCDKHGMLIWQDFMFACSLYPADEGMLANIKKEAEYNVTRLRNHPCIALWCGNNENILGLYQWRWLERYKKQGVDQIILKEYKAVFEELLPEVVRKFSDTDYRSTSPIDVPGGTNHSVLSGDMHYWDVWVGKQHPIMEYTNVLPRFMSEYGFQSLPDFNSIKRFTNGANDWTIDSEVMLSHQRSKNGNNILKKYIEMEYGKVPQDFETFIYISQLMQADAMKIAQEAHRRNMPYTMGSLYWQLNDCWPAASWSSIDYYGRWKAVHYTTREALKSIIVSPIVKNDTLKVNVVSDKLKKEKALFTLKIQTFDGKKIFSKEFTTDINPNTSTIVFKQLIDNLILSNHKLSDVFIYVSLKQQGEIIAENTYLLDVPKNLHIPKAKIEYQVTQQNENELMLKLTSSHFAKGIFIYLDDNNHFFSDNYFNMIPEMEKTIYIKTTLNPEEMKQKLKIYHYWTGMIK